MTMTQEPPLGEIPGWEEWDRVKNSEWVGEVGDRVSGEVTIVKVFPSPYSKGGPTVGYLAVDDAGHWFKWFTPDLALSWRHGVRILLKRVKVIRHDPGGQMGLKTNVFPDIRLKDKKIEVIG